MGPDHWFWDPAHSGGIHIERGVHFFDAASALMGSDPIAVQGTAVRRDGGPVDIVVATATHPGGAVATHTHSFTHAHRAERQLMRLDYGFTEARVTGWIPTFATVTAWTDEADATRWERLPDRREELLAVPGPRPHGQERITVSVTRGAGSDRPASGRGVGRVVPHRVDCVIDLGGKAGLTATVQDDDRNSMLALYRAALRLRRGHLVSDATLKLDGPDNGEWFGFERGAGLRCVVNFGTKPLPLDHNVDVLLASAPLDGRSIPQDAAVWMMHKEYGSERQASG
ncbi:Gfo/Idh/MocA family oxidoreductase [Streptomyces sp. NPDC001292]|uniref:Gfo/Idh/MocA family protein n=1 Tax=Streptomyces sp. NPDC001292 TaxID=3364558 RepID=UPI00368AEC79